MGPVSMMIFGIETCLVERARRQGRKLFVIKKQAPNQLNNGKKRASDVRCIITYIVHLEQVAMSQISAKECCTSDIIIFCQLFCFMSMIRLLAITVVALGICASGVDGARRRGSKMFNDISHKTPDQHHETVAAMSRSGQHMSVIEYLENLMKHVDNLNFDDRLPSLYSYLGVAYHDASRSHEAIKAFQNCSLYHTRVIDPRYGLEY